MILAVHIIERIAEQVSFGTQDDSDEAGGCAGQARAGARANEQADARVRIN